ncbi:MAG: FkbM family methyltransferase [Geobacteraceae bacterium]|nr:FkbM family methyltransferase [Geobacteraceae bacterium]
MGVFEQYYDALRQVGILDTDFDNNGEKSFLVQYLSGFESPMIFDVGAHHGDYSIAAKKICSSSKIYAFEPHPVTFARLRENTIGYGIKVLNFGLGSENSESMIFDYVDQDGSQHASIYKEIIEVIHRGKAVSHAIKLRTLDDLVVELGVKKINLLKIDTEGNELSVLRGAEKTIRNGMVDVIQFEFNEMNVITRTFFKDFYEFLPEYDFYRLSGYGPIHIKEYIPTFCEIFAYQNIICVKKV